MHKSVRTLYNNTDQHYWFEMLLVHVTFTDDVDLMGFKTKSQNLMVR